MIKLLPQICTILWGLSVAGESRDDAYTQFFIIELSFYLVLLNFFTSPSLLHAQFYANCVYFFLHYVHAQTSTNE